MRTTKLAAALILALGAVASAQEEPPQEKKPDLGKRAIETPTERLLPRDERDAAGREAAKPVAENPKVAPGLVKWHADIAAAKSAAAKSERPVLLLQILGDLDLEFC